MGKTSIEWTEETWNPVTGCSKVSPGCAHCYAESLTRRFASTWGVPDLPWTPANAATNVILHPERLHKPSSWQRPRMVFVNSMSDLFHEEVPAAFIAQVFEEMGNAFWHTFQVLTKRPERMAALLNSVTFRKSTGLSEWPLPNVWLGTSIENRRFTHRADILRQVDAAVRFISAEPLLGPLSEDLTELEPNEWGSYDVIGWADGYDGPQLQLHDIHWLIVGGESGPGHRPMHADWVRDLRDRCEYGETAFFFKQWGGATPKAGGRELDGRTWDEMPAQQLETTGAPA